MNSLEETILSVLETEHPDKVKDLVMLVQKQVDAAPKAIQQAIKELHNKGLVSLEEPFADRSLFDYLSSKSSLWFWLTIALSIVTILAIIILPETGTVAYVSYFFGFVLVAFLPGYCLTETLFPKQTTLDTIERITFSIGLSFAVTALTGLLLSFTPFGLTLSTSLPALAAIVVVLAVVALIRKYKNQ
jgi:hypothetical protein